MWVCYSVALGVFLSRVLDGDVGGSLVNREGF